MNKKNDADREMTNNHALTDNQLAELSKILFSVEASFERKEKVLHILAHAATDQAYQILSAYKECPDEELRFEAEMAYDECSFFMLQDTLAADVEESDDDLVFTGVGKKNNMMRMYYLVLPHEGHLFETWQHDIIRREMTAIAKKFGCEGIEWFDCQPHYVGFSLLQSLNVSVSAYIDTAIDACNEQGNFIFPYNYASTGIPTPDEIDEIIKAVLFDGDEEPGADDAKPCDGEYP